MEGIIVFSAEILLVKVWIKDLLAGNPIDMSSVGYSIDFYEPE